MSLVDDEWLRDCKNTAKRTVEEFVIGRRILGERFDSNYSPSNLNSTCMTLSLEVIFWRVGPQSAF